MTNNEKLLNYVAGQWRSSRSADYLNITNPATAEVLARVPVSTAADVEEAASAAMKAAPEWRAVPVTERIQYLFKLKNLLETNIEDIARILTKECGKTRAESMGELRRGIENV